MSDFQRAFIALPVEPWPTLYTLLQRDLPPALRPQHPADLHVTLAFLGDCDAEALDAVWDTVRERSPPPLQARLEPPAPFGGSRPRAWGYPLGDVEPLVAWLEAMRPLLLQRIGSTADSRPIRPHLTIAWLRTRRDTDPTRWPAPLTTEVGRRVALRAVAAYCRTDASNGARYRILRHLALPTPGAA